MKHKKKDKSSKYDRERFEQMGEHADALNPKVVVDGKPHLTMKPDRAKVHIERYKTINRLKEGKSVIDCPCGFGYASKILDYEFYSGFDISETAINYANARYKTDKASFHLADATKPINYSADTVISVEGIEHLLEPEKLFANLANCANKELIISYPEGWPINAMFEDGQRVAGGYHVSCITTDYILLLAEKYKLKQAGMVCMDDFGNVYPHKKFREVQLPCSIVRFIK